MTSGEDNGAGADQQPRKGVRAHLVYGVDAALALDDGSPRPGQLSEEDIGTAVRVGALLSDPRLCLRGDRAAI